MKEKFTEHCGCCDNQDIAAKKRMCDGNICVYVKRIQRLRRWGICIIVKVFEEEEHSNQAVSPWMHDTQAGLNLRNK